MHATEDSYRSAALRDLAALTDAVQQGEALHAYLPALAAALPAARSSLAELQAQEMEQLKAKVLTHS